MRAAVVGEAGAEFGELPAALALLAPDHPGRRIDRRLDDDQVVLCRLRMLGGTACSKTSARASGGGAASDEGGVAQRSSGFSGIVMAPA